jgi:hypothetical protein
MPRAGDVALFEQLFREWQRGEFWNPEAYAEDILFVRSGPDGGEYHGHGGISGAWRDFLGAWEDFCIVGERVIPGAADRYVLFLRLHGRGKESHLTIEQEVASLITMRDGRIVRMEMVWDRDAALRAAGVDDRSG